jgi:hypothetical protein
MKKTDEQVQESELKKLEEYSKEDIPVEKEVEKEPALTAVELAGLAMIGVEKIFQAMAYKRGGHWLLNASESEKLQRSLARVIGQYSVFDHDSPWMGLAACAGSVVMGRLIVEQVLLEKEKPVSEQVQGESGGD